MGLTEREMLLEFERACGHNPPTTPTYPNFQLACLRAALIYEESKEACEAIATKHWQGEVLRMNYLVQVAKELCDVLYVVHGTAVQLGIDLAPIFAAVHASNMTKDFSGMRRGDGKILKGDAYVPPDIESIIRQQLEGR